MSRNKEVLEAFESFRQKHSKQNREIIVNNTLLNIRNQQLQQDLARMWDENTQLRLQLSQSNHQLNVRHNRVIDRVVNELLSLKSDYTHNSSAPTTTNPVERRVLAAAPELESIEESIQAQLEDEDGSYATSSSDNELPSEEAVQSRLKSRRRQTRTELPDPKLIQGDKEDAKDVDTNANTSLSTRKNKRRNSADETSAKTNGNKKTKTKRKSSTKAASSEPSTSASTSKPGRKTQRRNSISTSIEPATETLRIRVQRTPDAEEREAEEREAEEREAEEREAEAEAESEMSEPENINVNRNNSTYNHDHSTQTQSRSPSADTEGRPSRRVRKSVNYALPNLRAKMRKPDPLDRVPADMNSDTTNALERVLASEE